MNANNVTKFLSSCYGEALIESKSGCCGGEIRIECASGRTSKYKCDNQNHTRRCGSVFALVEEQNDPKCENQNRTFWCGIEVEDRHGAMIETFSVTIGEETIVKKGNDVFNFDTSILDVRDVLIRFRLVTGMGTF